ncbi:head maturation protease, ClpP-related [Endozoicomonas atrinae]|uniref:head maturation protease, ClpP-related n=1 Tax=Endozoicomonas atrinae TaxID=1333660 RepID=UPI000825CE3D|nr:head maturation protease, ClpP-related [Endozoicomonas atrinae]
MSHNRQWFSFKNEAGQTPELFIYDDIDDWWGVSAQSVVDQIRDMDAAEINVRINCRGGMVFEGIAIYNALRLHKANVHISIEGLAASIASVIAMAGDTVTIAENAMMMIHNPYGWATGDAEAMRKTADVMDKIADSIAVSYTARTGKSIEELKALMEAETWFTAQEALDMGLVDQIDEPVKAAACFDLSRFTNAPAGFGRSEEQPENKQQETEKPDSEKEPEASTKEKPDVDAVAIAALCNQAGYPEKTEAFLKEELSETMAKDRLNAFDEIKNLCKAASQESKAAEFIVANKSLDDVRSELFDLLTKDDQPIHNTLTPQQQGLPKPSEALDTQAIYSRRNRA